MNLSVKRLLQLAAATTLVTAFAIAFIDAPMARLLDRQLDPVVGDAMLWVIDWPALFWLHKWGSLFVLGVIVLGLLISPRHRHYGPQLLALVALHVGCRLLVNEMKGLSGRVRPSEWLKTDGSHMFWFDRSSAVAFPSGHTTQFASIFLPLATFFALPRWATYMCIVVPFVVGLARILQNAHFVSDVTGAVAVCAALTAAAKSLGAWAHPWLSARLTKNPR